MSDKNPPQTPRKGVNSLRDPPASPSGTNLAPPSPSVDTPSPLASPPDSPPRSTPTRVTLAPTSTRRRGNRLEPASLASESFVIARSPSLSLASDLVPNQNSTVRNMEARKLIEDYILHNPSYPSKEKVQDLKSRLTALYDQPRLDIERNIDSFVRLKQTDNAELPLFVDTFITALSPLSPHESVDTKDSYESEYKDLHETVHGSLEHAVEFLRREASGEAEGSHNRSRLDHIASILDTLVVQVSELHGLLESVVGLKKLWESAFADSKKEADNFKADMKQSFLDMESNTELRIRNMEKRNEERLIEMVASSKTELEDLYLQKLMAAGEKCAIAAAEKESAKLTLLDYDKFYIEKDGLIRDLTEELRLTKLTVDKHSHALDRAHIDWNNKQNRLHGQINVLTKSKETGEAAERQLVKIKEKLAEARAAFDQQVKLSAVHVEYEKKKGISDNQMIRGEMDALKASHQLTMDAHDLLVHFKITALDAAKEVEANVVDLERKLALSKEREVAAAGLIDTLTAAMSGNKAAIAMIRLRQLVNTSRDDVCVAAYEELPPTLEVEGRSKWDYVVKAWFNGDRELAKSGSLDAARYNVMEGTRTDLNLDDWEVYIEALAAEEEDDDGFLEFLFKMAEFSETRYGGNYESHDMYATRADYEEAIRDYGHPSEAKHLTRCLNAVEKVKSLSDRARTHKLGADLRRERIDAAAAHVAERERQDRELAARVRAEAEERARRRLYPGAGARRR